MTEERDRISELAEKYGDDLKTKLLDPHFFVGEVIHGEEEDYSLTSYQKEWLELLMTKKKLNIEAFRSSGKSQLFFVDYPIYKMFTQPGWQGVITSRSFDQAKELLRRIRDTITQNQILKTSIPSNKESDWSKTHISLKNGARCWARPNTSSIVGLHVDFVGGDEIGYWKEMDVITKYIPPMLMAKGGVTAFVGTPTSDVDPISELKKNKSYFSKTYSADRLDAKTGKTYWAIRYPKTKMEDVRATYDSMSWSREFLCKPLGSGDRIYPLELVSQCFDRSAKFTTDHDDYSTYFMGVDFALSAEAGSDFTVLSVLQKKNDKVRLINMERHRGLSYQAQKKRIIDWSNTYRPIQVLIDEGTFGKAFLQDLTSEHVNVVGFRFTNESKQNLHTNLRNMFEQKRIVLNYSERDTQTKFVMDLLIRELDKFGYVTERIGNNIMPTVKLQGLGEHDDMVSALALSAWAAKGSSNMSWKIGRGQETSAENGEVTYMGRVN